MPLFSLKLPAGMQKNGTLLQAAGRWYTGTLVRFYEGSVRPVGGWQELTASQDVATEQFGDTFVDEGDGTDLPDHTPSGSPASFAWTTGSYTTLTPKTFYVDTDTGYTDVALLYNSTGWGIGNTEAVNVADGVPDSADYAVHAHLTFPVGSDRFWWLGVSGRGAADGGSCYRLELNDNDGELRLTAIDSTGATMATDSYTFTPVAGQEYLLTLQMRGTAITGLVDGVEYVSLTDSTYTTAGFAGVFGRKDADGGTGEAFLSDFSVTGLDNTTITLSGVPRAVLGWRGNDGSQAIGVGTNSHLYAQMLGHLYDITPSGFTTGNADATVGTGVGNYGDGNYGDGPYGGGGAAQGSYVPPDVWHLDTFGEYLVGCMSPSDGDLYYWDRVTSNVAVLMTGAPSDNQGIVVTPERYVVAIGANGNVRDVRWAAQESLTNWTESAQYATGTLTSDATAPSDGDTVTIGSKTYTFKTTLGTADGEVLIGGSAANALSHLKEAVNLTGSPGTNYTTATTANTQVSAGTLTATTLVFTALSSGTAGNTIGSTETSSHLSFGGTTLSGGTDDGGAGNFTLEGKGALVAGRRSKGETLLWTTDELYAMRYIGGTLVYAFEKMGSQCGLIAANAMAQPGILTVWMSHRGFFLYDGNVQPLPSEVSDYVFSDFNAVQQGKVTAYTLAEFGEVRWHYPSSQSEENDRYVTWNYRENHWAVGELERTAGCDAGALDYPVLAASNGKLYEHERSYSRLDTDGVTELVPTVEAGPVQLGDGDQVFYVSQMVPDERNPANIPGPDLGNVALSLFTSFYPGEDEVEHGPFTVNKLTDCRFSGRWVRPKLTEVVAGDWRFGELRMDGKPGGRR